MTWEGLSPPYRTIVADPPWTYERGYVVAKNGRDKEHNREREVVPMPYSTMTVEDIAALSVAELADANCWCWLWTTNRYLPAAFTVMERWGFTYRQTLVWHKTGNPSPFGGSVAPNHAEFLLLGAKGSPPVVQRLKGSVFPHPRTSEHSRKPEAVLDAIEACTPAPRVELFARRIRFGWDHWGFGYEESA